MASDDDTSRLSGPAAEVDSEAVFLLLIAALCITTVDKETFTREELLAQARCLSEDSQTSDESFDEAMLASNIFVQGPDGSWSLK